MAAAWGAGLRGGAVSHSQATATIQQQKMVEGPGCCRGGGGLRSDSGCVVKAILEDFAALWVCEWKGSGKVFGLRPEKQGGTIY